MSQEFESGAKQSLKTFAADINQALQSNLLSFSEAIEFSSALGVIKARLDSHRNSFVPINKLPAEILARIFEFVIAPEPLQDPGDWPASIPPQEAVWNRRLVLVCTRWCTIATKCQRMWYFIVDKGIHNSICDSPGAVLRRSGSTVPLHLYMTSAPQPATASVCRWVIENQPLRAEALFLQLLHDTPAKTILESLATPLPLLRLLSVDGQWQCREVLDNKMPAILGGGAPGLRALMWSRAIPFIPGNAFPNLADLNITFSDSNVLSLDRLLRLLSNCPRLETLNVKESSLDVTTGIAPDRRPVALDRLRALWIQSMPINAALATLAHLRLPPGTTVRLSELTRFLPEPVPPKTIPFLQQMDDLIRLDLVASRGRLQPFFHLVAVGARSRFWIHFDLDAAGVSGARAYVRHLCGMLPTKSLRTLRVSVADVADLVVIRDALLEPLPSLDTLLMRHSTTASPAEAALGIAAVSKALCPGGGPEDTVKESDTDSDEYVPDDGSDTDSDTDSGTDSNGGSDGGSDDGGAADAAGQSPSPDTPGNHDSDAAAFPIDISAAVPAPHLKVVGLQVKCGGETASLKSFVRMVEARKQSGHPLDTVLCSLNSVDAKDVDNMKAHVVDGVHDVPDALWVPTIDEGWRVRNDYWRLYPERREDYNEADYLEWGFFMTIW